MFESTHATIIAPAHKRWKRIERKTVGLKITAAFVLLTFLTMLFHGNWFLVLLLIGLGVGFWQFNESWQRYCQRADVLEDVQSMTSAEFARYAAELLHAQGYSILSHGLSSHPQADLLLVRGKEYIACWLYNGRRTLGSGLVRRVAANVQPYDEWRAMVLSSQRLTVHARYRARRERCLLLDRDILANLIIQYRRGHKVIAFPCKEATGLRGRK